MLTGILSCGGFFVHAAQLRAIMNGKNHSPSVDKLAVAVLNANGIKKKPIKSRLDIFLDKLTLVYRPSIGPPQVTKLWKLVPVDGIIHYQLPRTTIAGLRKVGLRVTIGWNNIAFNNMRYPLQIDLHLGQEILVQYLCENIFTEGRIAAGTATCILNLKPGMGKTFVAAGLIARIGLRALYVVPRLELATQAMNDLTLSLSSQIASGVNSKSPSGESSQIASGVNSNNGPSIGIYKKGKPTYDITIIIINSAVKCATNWFEQFSLVIMDEVHCYCSPSWGQIFALACCPMVIGMSGTTEEKENGLDVMAHRALAHPVSLSARKLHPANRR